MKRSHVRRLSMESLENRALLAGNVLASVDASGLLSVTGDDAANLVVVRQLPAAPSTTWQGFRYSIEHTWTPKGEQPTTINGESAVVVEGVKNVNIAMGDGADVVYVNNRNRPFARANLPGTVNIDMGDSPSAKEFDRDSLVMNVENHQQMNLNLGRGRDYLNMRLSVVHELNVLGDPVFNAGDPPVISGDDELTFRALTANGPVTLDTKYGNDKVELLQEYYYDYRTGTVTRHDMITTNSTATLTINTGTGDDRVTIYPTQLKAPLRIDTGDGRDSVLVSNVEESTVVTVNTGRGNDFIMVQASPGFPKLSVWCGEGDDRILLHSIKSAKTVFGGGGGSDTLDTFKDYPSDLGDATITGFEIRQEIET